MSQTDQMIQDTAQLLEESGLPASEALEIARDAVQESQTVQAGARYGGLHAHDLADLWNEATRSGAKRLVLEITCEPLERSEWHHISVHVLERDDWNSRRL